MPVRCRSALFMPASNMRAVDKARTLPCDAVILDLEDAVAPEAKATARDAAAAAVGAGGFGGSILVVRVNADDTPWHADDLAAVRAAAPDAVLVPKLSGAGALARLRGALGEDGPPLWAMIETPAGVLDLPAIAMAAPGARLEGLVAGTNDLAKDLRCRPDAARSQLVPVLSQIVVAARAGGMLALDGVANVIDDADRLAAECAAGAALGFDGKTLIHPAQIAAANGAFAPGDAEVARARAIVAAFASPGAQARGAIRLDGEMIELLHLAQARQLLALVD